MNRIVKPSDIKNFIFAGNSIFTVKNIETEKHFTYKVYNPNKKTEKKDIFFCSVLTGRDNQMTTLILVILKMVNIIMENRTKQK